MSRVPLKPYLIAKDPEGRVRLTVREIRYNSQNYPLVTETLQEEVFPTATAARAFAKAQFGAEAGQFDSR